jgi:isopropylmalate/homocitrate/citramalate synthase
MKLEDFYFKMPPLKTEPVIDDTTLRDGIQMPGLAVGPKDAAEIAKRLCEVGSERIEMFHYQEPDKQAAKLIHSMKLDCRVAAWCRAVKEDIDSAIDLGFEEVGISHPVSFIHFEAKWPDKTADQLLANVVDVVEYALRHGCVWFTAGRTRGLEFEKKYVNAVAIGC